MARYVLRREEASRKGGGGGGEGLEDGGGEWSIEGMQGVGRGVIIVRTERKSVLKLG